MRHNLLAAVAVATALVMTAALGGQTAMAGGGGPHGATLWVNQSAPVGSDTSCSSPGYQTIGAAVTAAHPGGSIVVCGPGTYLEQVNVAKDLTITGQGNPTISPPAAPTSNVPSADVAGSGYALVAVDGAKLDLSNISLNGPWTLPGACEPQFYGAYVYAHGSLDIHDANVANIRNSDPTLYGCQQGVGIQAGEIATSPPYTTAVNEVGHADINNVTVSGYQKGGIVFDNDGSTGSVTGSKVIGAGAGSPDANPTLVNQIAQNGIQISDGALASVKNSTVSYNQCDDAAGNCGSNYLTQVQSIGILIYDAADGVDISQNTLTGNDLGIYAQNRGTVTLENNSLNNDRYVEVALDQGNTVLNNNNLTVGSGATGVFAVSFAGETADVDGQVHGGSIVLASNAQASYQTVDENSTPPGPYVNLTFDQSRPCGGNCQPPGNGHHHPH